MHRFLLAQKDYFADRWGARGGELLCEGTVCQDRRGGRSLWPSATAFCPSRAMLLFALPVSPLFGESVHYEIHLLGYLGRCNLPIGLSSWEDQVRTAQSPLVIRSAIPGKKSCGHPPLY